MPAEIDLWRGFVPTGSQLRFFRSRATGRLFSSGAGSGKSKTGCRESIRWANTYAGSRNGIFRLTAERLRKSTMVTFWKEMNEIGFIGGTEAQMDAGRCHYVHNRSDKEIHWYNRSVTIYGHLEDEEGLGSQEYTSVFVDEGSEVPTSIYQILFGTRLRWHLPGCDHEARVRAAVAAGASDRELALIPDHCPHGMWVCTNPGSSGYLNTIVEEGIEGWEWIKAAPGDNPYNGPDYYWRMDSLEKVHGRAFMKRYRDGEWGAFEGQRFTMFDEDVHVLRGPWRPTDAHRFVCGWDFGHVETFVSFMAYMPDREEPVVVFDEVAVNEVQEPSQVADAVKAKMERWGITKDRVIHMGDPAGDSASQVSNISPIGVYGALGIPIAPCRKGKKPTDRANLLAKFLVERKRQLDGTEVPGIMFLDETTKRTRKSITNLRWKPQTSRLGEDPREQFIDKDKHGFDGLTYGIYLVPPPDLPKPKRRPAGRVNVSLQASLAESG